MQSPDLQRELNMTFTILTNAEYGILLYHGSKSRSHLAIELFKGRVRVSFDLGGIEPVVNSMYTYAKVNDSKADLFYSRIKTI